MKDFVILLAVLSVIFIPTVQAQPFDSCLDNNQYQQYSVESIDNPYSPYNQNSMSSINNPYSPYNQNSLEKLSNFPAQKDLLWQPSAGPGLAKDQSAKKAKESREEALVRNFFGDSKPKNGIPVFFYLLVLATLAVGLTIFVTIGILKK